MFRICFSICIVIKIKKCYLSLDNSGSVMSLVSVFAHTEDNFDTLFLIMGCIVWGSLS